jgi:hypothetical protein
MSDELPEQETEDDIEEATEEELVPVVASNFDPMYLVPQDTPIAKASILDLEGDQQLKFIEALQERRKTVYIVKERVKRSVGVAKDKNRFSTAEKLQKIDEKLTKALEKIDDALIKAEKLFDDAKVLRMSLGEFDDE